MERHWIAITCILLLLPLALADAKPPEGETVTVTVEEGQGVRDLAALYLGDADLWEDILDANDLKKPEQVEAGMALLIPATDISRAVVAIDEASETIQQAAQLGARVYAPRELDKATSHLNDAHQKRLDREWSYASELAAAAKVAAQEAVQISEKNRNIPAQAVILYAEGRVELMKAGDMVFNSAQGLATLGEEDRVRTFHGSFANLQFRDGTIVLMGQNAQVQLELVRVDAHDYQFKSVVRVIEGRVTVIKDKTVADMERFTVVTDEAQFGGKAPYYTVARLPQKTMLSCFEGALTVTAGDNEVAVEAGFGIVARKKGALDSPQKLPAIPKLDEPAEEATVYNETTTLTWSPLDGVDQYRVETAKDRQFRELTRSASGIQLAQFELEDLSDGDLFWRVAGVAINGVAGHPSAPRMLTVAIDHDPPFLSLHQPQDGAIVREGSVEVAGVTETGMQMYVKGYPVDVREDGSFTTAVKLNDGDNEIRVRVIDPAGNETLDSVTVTWFANETIPLSMTAGVAELGPNTFLSQHPKVSLHGETSPLATVEAASRQSGYTNRSMANDEGDFLVNVELREATEVFDLLITSPSGLILPDSCTITVDTIQPVIVFDEPPPATTSGKTLTLSGRVEGGVTLLINRDGARLDDEGRFNESLRLDQGKNEITLEAYDEARNPAIRHLTVELDTRPPELVRALVDPLAVSGGELVRVTVKVEDPTGMHEAAPFIIQVDEYRYTGALKLSKAYNDYRGTVRIPAGVKGPVRLVLVRIEDYNGNRRDYKF